MSNEWINDGCGDYIKVSKKDYKRLECYLRSIGIA